MRRKWKHRAIGVTPSWMLGQGTISLLFFYKAVGIRQSEDVICAAPFPSPRVNHLFLSLFTYTQQKHIWHFYRVEDRIIWAVNHTFLLRNTVHPSALQSPLRWICQLRHLGMFLMVCCQAAIKQEDRDIFTWMLCGLLYNHGLAGTSSPLGKEMTI